MAKRKIKTFRHSLHQPPGVYLLVGLGAILLAVALTALTGMAQAKSYDKSPASCSGWTNCANALADGGKQATAAINAQTTNSEVIFSNYGFSIPGNNKINSVVVNFDGWGSNSAARMDLRVSNNGGKVWGPAHTLLGSKTNAIKVDVTDDLSWSGTRLGNTYLRVKVDCYSNDGTRTSCNLDWIPIKVSYAGPFGR